MMTIKSPLLES